MIGLGAVIWGSSPEMPITFLYEKQRSGADMQYRVQVRILPVSVSSHFGYPIYVDLTIGGKKVDSVTMKYANPSQWWTALTYTSEWHTVSNKITGTTPVSFKIYSGSGSTRNNTYTYSMEVDPASSTVSASDGTLSTTLYLNVTRHSSAFTHTIQYTCGSVTNNVCVKSSATTVAWDNSNGNVSALALQNLNGQTVDVTFTIITYDGAVVVGGDSTTVTMAIPDNVRPSVGVSVEDAAGYLDTYGAYVQGWSKLKITTTTELAHGSPIRTYAITADGRSYDTNPVITEVVQGKGLLPVTAKVTDARSRSSDVASVDIPVLEYSKPSVNVIAYRCNSSGAVDSEGAYMKVGFTATIADLNGKNIANYTINYGGTPITGEGTSYTSAPIACDVSYARSVEVTVSDKLDKTAATAVIPVAFTLMDYHNSGEGVAFGKVATRKGFDCAMDAYFTGKVTIGTKLLIDLIYPVGSIYMSINNVSPQTFFGGTWERIVDRFLLGAGNTYTAGGTGGSATHTLTVNEMPNHYHTMQVATSSTTASDAGWRASGVRAYSSQQTNSASDNIKDVGGNAAHNNMPPYLAVYMWKRTA